MAKCSGTAEEVSENSPVTQSAPAALGPYYTSPKKAQKVPSGLSSIRVAPTFRSTSKDDVFLSFEKVPQSYLLKNGNNSQVSLKPGHFNHPQLEYPVGTGVIEGSLPNRSLQSLSSHANLKASASRFFEALAKNPKIDASKMVQNYEDAWQKFQNSPKYESHHGVSLHKLMYICCF